MALGFTASEGAGGQDFLPILKYDSRSRIWNLRTRVQVGEQQWENREQEISLPSMPTFMADLEEVEIGWIRYAPTPDFQTIRASELLAGTPFPPRPPKAATPQESYRQGFRVTILMSDDLGGDLRQFSHNSACVRQSFNCLHDLYLAEKGKYPMLMPIVRVTGYIPVKTGEGTKISTNYAPIFTIDGWGARPTEFDQVPVTAHTPAPNAPSSGGTHGGPVSFQRIAASSASPPSHDPPPYGDQDAPPPTFGSRR